MRAKTVRIFPDGGRVEQALVAAAAETGFVDASGYLSFAQLVEACGGARKLARRPCSPLTSRAVLWAAARSLAAGPFQGFAHEPSFARSALELVFELKAGNCPAGEFATAVETLPPARRARGAAIARLYRAYDDALERLGLADREDLLRGAVEALGDGLPAPLEGCRAVEVRDVYDFSPQRLRLVLSLAERCQAAGVHFRLEVPGAGSPAVDAQVNAVLGEFERRWEHLEVEARMTDLTLEDRPLAGLGKRLFGASPSPPTPAPELAAFSAATPRDEAKELARRVRALVDAGTAPEQIAIAFRDLGDEAEALVEALEAVGVSARSRLGAPLASTTVGGLALDLPLLADDEFPAAGVARYLESRYAPKVSERAPDAPAKLLALAAIRDDRVGAGGGKGAYGVRLGALAKRLEERDDLKGARAARDLLASATRLMEIGRGVPEKGKAAAMLRGWWRGVEGLGLLEATRKGEPRSAEETALGRAVMRALARDQAAAEALRELAAELDSALRESGAGELELSRRTFYRWLRDAAAELNLAPRGPRGGAVRLLDLRELAGASYQHLFVGGLVDGRFPGRGEPRPLFPEEDRAGVNRALHRPVFRLSTGEGKPGEGRLPARLAEDRLLLHLALSAAHRTVTLSHARTAGGREQLASPFLDELRRLTGLAVEERPRRPVATLDELGTEPELRARAALEILATPELRATEPDPARSSLEARLFGEPWFQEAAACARIEHERLFFFSDDARPPGPFTGDAGSPALSSALHEAFRFGPERPLSASALAKFGNCRFQGFLSQTLKLGEPESPGEELDALGKGSFWHGVLERLMPALKEHGLLGKAADEVPAALIDASLDAAAEESERRNHVGHPALWRIGRERGRAMVRRLLDADHRGLPFDGLLPEQTELVFGPEAKLDAWREVVVPAAEPGEEPIHLKGKIDRLDGGGGAGVVDYKSGADKPAAGLAKALLVTDFQVPLYLYAARRAGLVGPLQAAWLFLKDGGARTFDEVLQKGGDRLDDLLETDGEARRKLSEAGRKNLASALHGLVAGLRAGKFPARPEDCGSCPYRAVCRITERRLEERGDA
ncbi:MAG: PD-(D/E)XK nuclease family protein [Myxococcaceae bacterium]